MDSNRAVLLRYTRTGEWRRGSGLRIGRTWVLTADHCVNQSRDLMVVVDGVEYQTEVAWRSRRADVDLAVLDAVGLEPLPQLPCARINSGISARIEGCVALGFPSWSDIGDSRRRAQVDGYIASAEGSDPYATVDAPELLALKITTPAIRDRPPVPAGDLDRETTPWGGMSGAVIVSGEDHILGVVRGHAPAAGVASLTFTPLAALDVLGDEVAAAGWRYLGVTDPHSLPLLPTLKIAGAAGVVVGQIPVRPLGFVRRTALDRLLDERDQASGAMVCAVVGMRGVGKTQVAAAYARAWIDAGHPGLVGWVNADTRDGLVADLAQVAEAVGAADPDGDSEESARRLIEHLATRTGDSLLVFDNATDPDALRPYLPAVSSDPVIITTTDTAFEGVGEVIGVDRFTRPESVQC